MANVKISQLPAGTPTANSVIVGENAAGTVTEKYTVGDVQALLSSSFAGLVDGKVPAEQLPSYVDDVVEAADFAALPTTGETGKIYVTLDTKKIYRWSGSTYIEINQSSVESVAGKTGVVTLDKNDVGLGNVDNTSDLDKPISTAVQAALADKADADHVHRELLVCPEMPAATQIDNADIVLVATTPVNGGVPVVAVSPPIVSASRWLHDATRQIVVANPNDFPVYFAIEHRYKLDGTNLWSSWGTNYFINFNNATTQIAANSAYTNPNPTYNGPTDVEFRARVWPVGVGTAISAWAVMGNAPYTNVDEVAAPVVSSNVWINSLSRQITVANPNDFPVYFAIEHRYKTAEPDVWSDWNTNYFINFSSATVQIDANGAYTNPNPTYNGPADVEFRARVWPVGTGVSVSAWSNGDPNAVPDAPTTTDCAPVKKLAFSDFKNKLAESFASLVDGKVPPSQLPESTTSSDVLEFDNFDAFPETGAANKIYVARDTNKIYRWRADELSPEERLTGCPLWADSSNQILDPQDTTAGVTVSESPTAVKGFASCHTNLLCADAPPNNAAYGRVNSGAQTFTFSRPVTNPVLALYSFGNDFGTETTCTASVPAQLYCGTVANAGCGASNMSAPLVVAGNTITGKEGFGIVMFPGTHDSITLTWSNVESVSHYRWGRLSCKADSTNTGTKFNVNPRISWQDTGVDVDGYLKITATGTVNYGCSHPLCNSGPDGVPPNLTLPDSETVWSNVITPCRHETLIARIGVDGVPFCAGAAYESNAAGNGRLYLTTNDTVRGDNTGSYEATIVVSQSNENTPGAYVELSDHVLAFADFAALPEEGAGGKIYVTLDTKKIYYWLDTEYVELAADVIEAASLSALPEEGDAGKIYVTLNDNKVYRWGGSAYVAIGNPDVIEAASLGALPDTGEISKIYITTSDNKLYRWSGSAYVEIGTNHNHDNRYYTETEIDAKLAAISGPASRNITLNGFTANDPTPETSAPTLLKIIGADIPGIPVGTGKAFAGTITVAAINHSASGGSMSRFVRHFSIKNVDGVVTVLGINTVGTDQVEDPGHSIEILANNAGKRLDIRVRSAVCTAWTAVADFVEVNSLFASEDCVIVCCHWYSEFNCETLEWSVPAPVGDSEPEAVSNPDFIGSWAEDAANGCRARVLVPCGVEASDFLSLEKYKPDFFPTRCCALPLTGATIDSGTLGCCGVCTSPLTEPPAADACRCAPVTLETVSGVVAPANTPRLLGMTENGTNTVIANASTGQMTDRVSLKVNGTIVAEAQNGTQTGNVPVLAPNQTTTVEAVVEYCYQQTGGWILAAGALQGTDFIMQAEWDLLVYAVDPLTDGVNERDPDSVVDIIF